MRKIAAIAAALSLTLFSLTGCTQSGAKTSAEATAQNPLVLTLAHGLSETHTVHIAMTEFANMVEAVSYTHLPKAALPPQQS